MNSLKIDKIVFFGKIITCNNVADVIAGNGGVTIVFETKENLTLVLKQLK